MRTPLRWLKDEGIFGWNYKHIITHPWIIFEQIYYHSKWFVQRGYRGYADYDNWSIDSYLNSWMPKAIRNLKVGTGYPLQVYLELFPGEDFSTNNPTQNNSTHSAIAHAKWHEILDIIALGFESGKRICECDFTGPMELNILQEQLKEGLRLFSHYYLDLWS